jgi:hypothetical protein
MNLQEVIYSTLTVALALVFGFILIQTLMFILFPVKRSSITVQIPENQEAPPWSYQYRYQNWMYGLPGLRGPLPPSSPYVPGVGRVWKV